MNRKVLLIAVGIIIAAGGYLGYDYYIWAKYLDPDPSVSLYGWTDPQGVRHYTDSAPPAGARDVQVTTGYKHRKLPWVMRVKEKIVAISRKDATRPSKKPAANKK